MSNPTPAPNPAPDLTFSEAAYAIKALTPTQRDAFSRICINDDTRISPRTGDALVGKGLVIAYEQQLPGRPIVHVRRHDVASYAVHMAWCAWASEQEIPE